MSAPDLVQAALAHQKNGGHEKALAGFEAALELPPDDAEIHASHANTLAILGRHDAALAGYAKVLALRPDAAAAYFYRGHTLAAMGRLAAALKQKMRETRASQPLFDTVRFTLNLESAYRTMRDTWLATPRV